MGVILNILPKTLIIGEPEKNYTFASAVPASGQTRSNPSGSITNPADASTSGPSRSESQGGGSNLVNYNAGLTANPEPPTKNQNGNNTGGGNGTEENIVTDTGMYMGGGGFGGGGGGGMDAPVEEEGKNLPAETKKNKVLPWLLVAGAAVLIIWAASSKKGKGAVSVIE